MLLIYRVFSGCQLVAVFVLFTGCDGKIWNGFRVCKHIVSAGVLMNNLKRVCIWVCVCVFVHRVASCCLDSEGLHTHGEEWLVCIHTLRHERIATVTRKDSIAVTSPPAVRSCDSAVFSNLPHACWVIIISQWGAGSLHLCVCNWWCYISRCIIGGGGAYCNPAVWLVAVTGCPIATC